MQKFLHGRINLVKALMDYGPEVTYADLVLILTAVISACSSIYWPGKGIDKKRFIELLVEKSPSGFRTSWISIPALINEGLINEAQTPYRHGNATRVYCDDEIDLSYDEAKINYPGIAGNLKKFSYASLIYEWLRCGYAHEYCPNENITTVPASRKNARISYIGRTGINGIKRMVSFHLDYLIGLAEYHVSALPYKISPQPSLWWIDKYDKKNDRGFANEL